MLTSADPSFIPNHRCSHASDTSPATSDPTPYPVQPLPELRSQPQFPAEPDETPRTLYLTSPGTEVGDGDFADQSDEDLDVVAPNKPRTHGVYSSSLSAIHRISPAPYTLGDLDGGNILTVDETDLKYFTHRLHEDIKSAALFPWMPSAALSSLSPPNTVTNTHPGLLSLQDPGSQPCPSAKAHDDVTSAVGPQRTQGTRQLSRKASMHLRTPSHPINPYQRPLPGRSPPPYPYPATMIDRAHLRRYQTQKYQEQTISMKDLIVPNAEFHCGFDPETLVLELTSPPLDDLDDLDDAEEPRIGLFSKEAGTDILIAEVSSEEQHGTPETPFPRQHHSGDSPHASQDGAYPSSSSVDSPSSPNAVSPEVPPPRRSTRASDNRSSYTDPPGGARRGLPYSSSKPRARHLQPNLVRTNGCQYGCQLFFSTAYEARRHQEDAHGREEAYKLMKLHTDDPNAVVNPREYRFLIQIGLHASGDKWDPTTKAAFQSALAQQDNQLDKPVASALLQFAREWTKRYECPRCGTSFSRLDSKKRHYEKQCR
ncbi:hypothetical protein FS837_004806 [Tulasnella sp. UAMH 9824]|nr:hypothetical protein FS837_004806 [Tulasnella sp. UAMH 9824]